MQGLEYAKRIAEVLRPKILEWFKNKRMVYAIRLSPSATLLQAVEKDTKGYTTSSFTLVCMFLLTDAGKNNNAYPNLLDFHNFNGNI